MDKIHFWRLCRIVRPCLWVTKRKKKPGAKNGVVPTPSKLSVALRWFAGGSACDVAAMHGTGHTDAFRSVWLTVDAVNGCEELAFEFPEDHDVQRKVVSGFFHKSKAAFSCCAGAVDGTLIQMEKPSNESCEQASCGTSKSSVAGRSALE